MQINLFKLKLAYGNRLGFKTQTKEWGFKTRTKENPRMQKNSFKLKLAYGNRWGFKTHTKENPKMFKV